MVQKPIDPRQMEICERERQRVQKLIERREAQKVAEDKRNQEIAVRNKRVAGKRKERQKPVEQDWIGKRQGLRSEHVEDDSDKWVMAAFMKAAQGHRFETLYLTMLFTGLRRGEACGLTWDCVNLEKGTILVNKQLQNIPGKRGEYRLVSTKSSRSRTITVAASVVTLLKKHKAQQSANRLKAGSLWQEGNYVFCNEVGEHLSPHTVYHNYKRIVASIGLPDARLHDLRHSFAVASIQAGDDLKTVQSNLGHATATFTLDVYGHVTQEMKQASADRMETFIKGVSGL